MIGSKNLGAMGNTILITGSSGTIGSALGRRLLSEDFDVVGVDRNRNPWSDEINTRTIVRDLRLDDTYESLPTNADAVIHLAANSRVRKSVENPELGVENLQTTHQILEFARKQDLPLVFSSSREVYGERLTDSHAESETSISDIANPYGASKAGGEAMVQAYHRCYGLETVVLRFTNVYGRYDCTDRVVPTFITRALDGDPLAVYGPEKTLDFAHLEDVIGAVVTAIERLEDISGSAINVGSGTGTSLVELAELIVELTGSTSGVTIEDNRTGEVETFIADIERARSLLDYDPAVSLSDGIERSIEWYRNQSYELPP